MAMLYTFCRAEQAVAPQEQLGNSKMPWIVTELSGDPNPCAYAGPPLAGALRRSSFAEAAGSPRVTPRHSRNSSIEALASAAASVQPYRARILYGARLLATAASFLRQDAL